MRSLFFCSLLFSICYFSSFRFATTQIQYFLHTHAANPLVMTDLKTPQTQYVTARDGTKIAFWYMPTEQAKAVVILVHGYSNPGGKTAMLNHVVYLQEAGYSVALLDLRAYGESAGDRVGLGTTEWQDVVAVYDHLAAAPENRFLKLGYLGISMGAVSSITAASQTGKGDFIIAAVPFASIDSLLKKQLSQHGLPPSIFAFSFQQALQQDLGKHYRSFAAHKQVSRIQVPILVMQAKQDEVVPSTDAVVIFEHARQPKELVSLESKHDLFYYQPEAAQTAVLQFLEQYATNTL